MQNNNKKLSVLTLVLSYVLSLLLVAVAALGVIQITVCNKGFLKTQVISSGFCDEVVAELTENFVSYGNAGGFSSEVMVSIIPKERVQSDMFTAVDSLYAGNRDLPEYTTFSQNAYDILAADVLSRNYTITEDVEDGLRLLADTCQADYTNAVNIPLTSYVAPILSKLQTKFWMPLVISLLFTAVAVVVIMITEADARCRLKACIYSCMAGLVSCLAFPVIAMLAINTKNLNISPLSLKMLIHSYYTSTLSAFFYFAVMYAIVVIALAVSIHIMNKKESEIYAETKPDRIADDNAYGATHRHQQPAPQPKQPTTPRPKVANTVRSFSDSEE